MDAKRNSELRNLDWDQVLSKIEGFATSALAKEAIQQILPLATAAEATRKCQDVLDGALILQTGLRPYMQSLDLFSTWHSRLAKSAVLKTLELKDIRSFCLEVIALKELLKEQTTELAANISQRLFAASEPLSAIEQIITPSGDIRSDASERLYSLHNEKEKLARDVQNQMEKIVRDHDMENILQDKFVTTREGRWVIPVRSGMQPFFPGVIHGSSQSKQTVYMEPEKLIPINNRLRQVEVEIEEEIERLLTALSTYLFTKTDSFAMAKAALLEVDICLAKAQLATLVNAQPVRFSSLEPLTAKSSETAASTSPEAESTAPLLNLNDLFHPLLFLSSQSSRKTIVPNSVSLAENKSILLLTGPNAGGKTVLLKSIGLAAQMARCGLPICASGESSMPFFKNILVSIGDAQSVGEDLSTFAAHLKMLSEAAALSGPDSLVLIDEICGSTDAEEGSALARAFIEEFSEKHLVAVITSHLSPLKSGWPKDSGVINGSLEYEAASGRPLYRFVAGVPGDSLAILTAKRAGVPERIITRSMEHLSPQAKSRINALAEVETMKHEILTLQEKLRSEVTTANHLKMQLQKKLDAFEIEKQKWLDKTLKKAEKQVQEAIQHTKAEDVLTRHRTLQDIKYQLPEIVKAKSDSGDGTKAPPTVEDFKKRYPPGSKIHIPSLGQDGIIESAPNAKGEVLLMSNSLRVSLPWQELRPASAPRNPTSQIIRNSPASFSVSMVESDRSLDLRGQMVEEALEHLEIALDKAQEMQDERIKIIHGHGTETLKRAVRTYLSRSLYVKKWKAGTPESGGDGVTWVELLRD